MLIKERFEDLWETRINTAQRYDELWGLISEVLNPNDTKTILEIGIAFGGTTRFWAELADRLIAVDMDLKLLVADPDEFACETTLIEGNSREIQTVEKVYKALGAKKVVDFLFVDGDHSAPGCLGDVECYYDLVRSGGIIAFHDIEFSGVRDAMFDLRQSEWFEYTEEGTFQDAPGTSTFGITWFRKR